MAYSNQMVDDNTGQLMDIHDIRLDGMQDMNVGANTYIMGYDSVNGTFGLVAYSTIKGNIAWFGRRWVRGNASPVGSPVGDLDLGRAFAETIGLGGYLVQNNHDREKLKVSNHNYKANGAAANLTGSAGHYQWGWNVPMYYQHYYDATYEYETFSLGGPRPGYWNQYIPIGSRSCAGYAAMDRTNSILMSAVNSTAQFRGGNNNSALDNAYNSQLCKPVTNMAVDTMRTAARKNGTLWFVNERCMQYVTAALKRVIFGNRNIQAAFNATLDSNGLRQGGTGQGIDLPNDWSGNFGYYPYIRLDVGIEQGDLTGLISTEIQENGAAKTINNIPSFYGLKNDYKYLGAISENMLLECNSTGSQSLYISAAIDGSNMDKSTTNGLKKIATSVTNSGWVYTKEYQLNNLSFFPGTETGGSSSTFHCDGYYNPGSTSGLRGASLLGNASYGVDAGSVFLDGDYAPSYASASIGGFLCEYAEAFTSAPFWCEEN